MHSLFLSVAVSIPKDIGEKNGATLEEGEEIRWTFEVPNSGLFFILTVTEGEAVFYASTKTTAPNEALHEWTIPPTSSEGKVFIQPPASDPPAPKANSTIFVTIVATAPGNTSFVLCTNEGM